MGLSDVLPPVLIELRMKATEVYSELGKVKKELHAAADEGEQSSSRVGKAWSGLGSVGQVLTKGVIGMGATFGGFAVESASAAEVVDAKLRTAITNAGGSMESFEPKINSVDGKLRGFGFTNDQTNTALTTLTVALKDPAKAMDAMSVTADLARQKNIDLNTAALLVSKAMEGQTRPLKALGIDLPVAAGNALAVKNAQDALAVAQQKVNDVLAKYPDAADKASKGHAAYEAATQGVQKATSKLNDAQNASSQIMDALKSRVSGAADAYGHTLRGQLDQAKAGVENMGESLGKILIPFINDAIQAGVHLFGFLQNNQWLLYAIGGLFGVFLVAAVAKWTKSLYDTTVEFGSKVAGWLQTADGWVAKMAQKYGLMATAAEESAAAQETAGTEAAAATEASAAEQTAALEGVQAAEEETAVVAETSGEAIAAAGGPITLIIAAIVLAATFLMTHWKEVWDAICTAAKWAYDNVIKPVADWIMKYAIQPVIDGAKDLGKWWGEIWDAISGAIQRVGKIIGDIIGGITGVIDTVIGAIQKAISWFTNLFDSANNATSASQRAINTAAQVQANMPAVNAINSNYSNLSLLHFPSHDVGGWIKAALGQPQLGVNHGGEYMLSLDMLAGRQPIDPKAAASIANNPSMAALMGGGPKTAQTAPVAGVTVYAQTNASPSQIATSVGWELRKRAS